MRKFYLLFIPCVLLLAALEASAQGTGTIRGTVKVQPGDYVVHRATVLLIPGGRAVETTEQGTFEFRNVAPGRYEVLARARALSDQRLAVTVTSGATAELQFVLGIAAVSESVNVTATGTETTAFESFQTTNTVESIDLVQKAHTSIGDVLDGQPGVAKRSFGAGSTRPVLRGFDGDRVLVLMDGLSSGSLGSQSGDHGESINALNIERVEVVRGPATLLYGSNAIGGVVNAISGQHQTHEHAHPGLSGYVSGVAGSANYLGGGSAGIEYGFNKWVLRAGGGGLRTGDYETPIGSIANSRTRSGDVRGGVGYYGDKGFFSLGYDYDNRRYGIPFAEFLHSGGTSGPDDEHVNIRMQRHDVKFSGGFRNLEGPISGARVSLGYTHYGHGEYEEDTLGTDFKNRLFNYRVTFDQQKYGRLTGTFGFSGTFRDYETIGAEALAPPTTQKSFGLFALETLDFDRIAFQFGGRFEHNSFDPVGLQPRSFNGFSGAAGVRVPLWQGGAFVANYTHSFRSPALEELYNEGPHPGNLVFEIGFGGLKREKADGIELSLRHRADRFRAEGTFFHYAMGDYIFLAPNGQVNIQSGLLEAEFLQGDARYQGGELNVEAALHPKLWLTGGLDVVRAELTQNVTSPTTGVVTFAGTPLPRIPPVRGRLGLDFNHKGLSVRPEAVFAAAQEDLFTNETRTAGYTVFNLGASYTVARQHMVHVFSVNSFNLGDRLYRNHLSFIKDLAPEIGRGVRFGYTVRFQ